MRLVITCALAATFGLASATLVACGDRNGLLPASSADALIGRLGGVSSAVVAHNCSQATAALDAARSTLAHTHRLRATLRLRLRAELDHLQVLATQECTPPPPTTTTAPTTQSPTTTTATTPTTTTAPTTQTQTTTTPTTTETTPTTTTTPTDTGPGSGGLTGPGSGGAGAPGGGGQ